MNSSDDPFIQTAYARDKFAKNENICLGTTQYGGHLGMHESIFKYEMWLTKPAKAFFNAIK